MLWVIQNNLFGEDGYRHFLQSLERLGCEYLVTKPVPFTTILLPESFDSATQNVEDVPEVEIDTNQKIIGFGTLSLSRIANERGWHPGTYLNDNFDYSVWREGFGEHNILNSDAVVGKIKNIGNPHNHDWVFLRPVDDSKAFSGMVLSKYDLDDWLASMSQIEEDLEYHSPLHKNTVIMISSTKEIYTECRVFVVDGKVVTASMYKQGSQVRASNVVDERITNFAQRMADQWQPDDAFVLDIADTPDGLKIIEINCINSSGLYAADTNVLIMALEDLNA